MSVNQVVKDRVWWRNLKSANDVQYTSGPPMSQSAIAQTKVWTAYDRRNEMDRDVVGQAAGDYFRSQKYDWTDVADQIVWQDRPTDDEGLTVYYVPYAKYGSDVKYSAMTFKRAPALGNAFGGPTGPLPPGPEGYVAGSVAPDQAFEFTVCEDGSIWLAKTPATSAKKIDSNPHAGISIINPNAWDLVAAGMSVTDALDLGDYKDKGWSGLNHKFLAWQGEGIVQPAGEELASAMDAAEAGDPKALRALRAVGVHPPKEGLNGGGLHFGKALTDLGF